MLSYILLLHSLDTIWWLNVARYFYVSFLGHNLIPQCCPIFVCSIPWTQFDDLMLPGIFMFHSLDTIWSPNVARYFYVPFLGHNSSNTLEIIQDYPDERLLYRWGLEYADCTPISGVRNLLPPKKKVCPVYGPKVDLIMTLKFWRSGKYGMPFHWHYFQIHSEW